MGSGLVTVACFRDVAPAHLLRGRLEAAGIPCVLADEHTIALAWTYSNLLGGVKVQVPEEHAMEAVAFVECLAAEHAEQAEKVADLDDGGIPVCPSCGAGDAERERMERWWAALALLTGVVVPIFGARLRCRECGRRWKEKTPYRPLPDIPAAGESVPAGRDEAPGRELSLRSLWWVVWILMAIVAVWMAASY